MSDLSAATCRVLIVEDEVLIGILLEDMILELGHSVAGNVCTLADAVDAVGRLDCNVAILDVNLGGEQTFELADRLASGDIPVVFSTGSDRSSLPTRFAQYPILEKPYVLNSVEEVLAQVAPSAVGK